MPNAAPPYGAAGGAQLFGVRRGKNSLTDARAGPQIGRSRVHNGIRLYFCDVSKHKAHTAFPLSFLIFPPPAADAQAAPLYSRKPQARYPAAARPAAHSA